MRISIRVLAAVLGITATGHAAVGVRLLMGLTDKSSVKWDGSAAAAGARIVRIEPWRFDVVAQEDGTAVADAIHGMDAWTMSTHRGRAFGAAAQTTIVPNGVIVWLEGESQGTQLEVKTAQGNFRVGLGELPYGKSVKLLDGRVVADRVPPSYRITNTPDEQDYPALTTDANGNLWLAYVEFRHHPEHDRIRQNYTKRPLSFDDMKAPTGGDQILVRKFAGNAWGPAIEITPPGGDLYRTAIAVDGSGRPWVFWSENRGGNFDIWARAIEGGKAGRTVQISREPGADIDPVAATDSQGRVWVAWQGWRGGKASIFAATGDGDRFSPPATVASSSGNEWNPAIAADKEGRVTVAWDSYRNGNYDVFCRTASGPGKWEREAVIADSARYEASPSIAYGADGKLWVAYEEGSEQWGKDFAAHDTKGAPLYSGRAVRVVALDRAGQLVTTRSDVGDVLPGFAGTPIDAPLTQNAAGEWTRTRPEAAKERKPNGEPPPLRAPKNNLPRLAADSSGRLWLTFRSAFPTRWSVIGTVWTEYVTSYDGNSWSAPIYLAHSDNLLDNRPAVVAMKPGELVVAGSSDGRADFPAALADKSALEYAIKNSFGALGARMQPLGAGPMALMGNPAGKDPYNNDLYASVVSLGPAAGPAAVKPAEKLARAGADAAQAVEQAAIRRMRELRVPNGGHDLRVVRGEFHRHSEVSMDGGGDGTLLDQWRYIIDTGALDWVGCCDHDNGGGREYSWWIEQKLTDVFYMPGRFAPLFSYERSVVYPEGHRNVLFVERGIRTLPRLPLSSTESNQRAPDTQMLYAYLRQFGGVVASHTSGTGMGTDWRDNDPALEPIVEIYQGIRQSYEMPGGPRANSEGDSIGGWRPKGFINLAFAKGYQMAFQSSSDHVSTHTSYGNVFVTEDTRQGVLEGLKRRHVYASTDNIVADVRSGQYMMGDAFTAAAAPELKVRLVGTAPFAKVHIIKDNQYVYSAEPRKATVEFTWRDTAAQAGKTSYYYVRGEQEDGELVWASPMWITYRQ